MRSRMIHQKQLDSDNDTVGDNGDNCPNASNVGQDDLDTDGTGNACDIDADGDGANGDGSRWSKC